MTELNSLKEGAWALQFGIRNNFTLSAFQGATIAAQYHLSARTALRAGISLAGHIGDGTSLNTAFTADTSSGSHSYNSSGNSATVGVTIQYLWYANPQERVQFYAGIGPSVSYNHSHSEQDETAGGQSFGSYSNSVTSNQNTWYVGATGVAGVEWFPARWFSLHVDYSEVISYTWSSTKSTDKRSATISSPPFAMDNTVSSKGWTISDNGVNFGLSIYF
jgi:hypothetical protein